ncbi:MAG TPA: hypothetical protein VIJ22_01435, partial [Polyangiaceae bacterium]
MHRALRRFAALLVLAIPVSFIGRAGATWGALRSVPVPPREVSSFEATPGAGEREPEERAEGAVVLLVLDGVRWQE